MKKKWIICGAVVLVAVLVVLAVFLIPWGSSDKENSAVYDKNLTSLDLSGQHNPDIDELMKLTNLQELDLRNTHITVEQYEKLHKAIPQCNIVWSVPVDGFYNDSISEEIIAVSFSEEAVDVLKYFPNLKKVDALNCDDYEYLLAAQKAYPDVKVHYKVPLGMAEIQSDCTGLKLKKVDVEALRYALTYLPNLKDVTFNGELPSEQELQKLVNDFPDVNFHW